MLLIKISMMILWANETQQKLIARYQDKIIINPRERKEPVSIKMDITDLNAILSLNKARIPTIITKLRKMRSESDNQIYNQSEIVKSEKYEFSKGILITKINEQYTKAKSTCEQKSNTASLPRPTPKEIDDFVKLIKELGVKAQILPAFTIGSDLIMTGNGRTLVESPNTGEYYKNIFYLSPENVYESLVDEAAKIAKGDVICLVDLQEEKKSKFHMKLFSTNSKLYEKNMVMIGIFGTVSSH